jgi:hypothetical protein
MTIIQPIGKGNNAIGIPNRVLPNASNATGKLVDIRDGESADIGHHLWIDDIQTGYKLNGSYGQSKNSRLFYPHDMDQNNIIVKGTMPNQAEYDKLVKFVAEHHENALAGGFAKFYLFPSTFNQDGSKRDYSKTQAFAKKVDVPVANNLRYRGWKYDVIILGHVAGHARFTYSPTYQLQLLVINDYLQSKDEIDRDLVEGLMDRYVNSLSSKKLKKTEKPSVKTTAPGQGEDTDSIWAAEAQLFGAQDVFFPPFAGVN